MTVVPLSFQLCGWLPAWWRGAAGGDDILELLGPTLMHDVSPLRASTSAITAFCPELGVGVLPGPKAVTEEAVAAGEAVIFHGGPGAASKVLVPGVGLFEAGTSRPVDLDLRQAATDFAQSVVTAEHELRASSTTFGATPAPTTVRPLPPGADPDRKALLTRAARMWTAVDAVPAVQRTPAMVDVLRCSARATLAAYRESVVTAPDRTRRFA
jgi:hypothetical protein